jgi:hypothetical protein
MRQAQFVYATRIHAAVSVAHDGADRALDCCVAQERKIAGERFNFYQLPQNTQEIGNDLAGKRSWAEEYTAPQHERAGGMHQSGADVSQPVRVLRIHKAN